MPTKPATDMLWRVLVGAALGAGAALLLTPARESVKAFLKPRMKGRQAGSAEDRKSEGTYCAVPEGADICFPEQ